MTSQVNLLCGPDPGDPSTLFELDLAFDESGQAYVFRGRGPGPGGRPVTVRVWRPRNGRDLAAQRASWRKGAALLRVLKPVGGICRPVLDFDGHLPWAPGTEPSGERVPIQVLEFIEGENLKDRLALGDLDGPRTLHALARILVDLHRRGPIVHQDIAPSNVIVTPSGDVVLIDFTSARSDGDLTHFAGKLEQAAPEVIERLLENDPGKWRFAEPGAASDVFGFGGIAYLLVTGSTWRTGLVETLDDVGLPGPLRAHLLRILTDDATDRMGADDLAPWVDRLTSLIAETGHPTPGVRWPAAPIDPVWGKLPVPQDPFHTTEAARVDVTAPRPSLEALPATQPDLSALFATQPELSALSATQPELSPVSATRPALGTVPASAPGPGFVALAALPELPAPVARPALPGMDQVVLVPGFVPGIAPRRSPAPDQRDVGTAKTGPKPLAETVVAEAPPTPGAPVTLVAAPQELDDADRVRFTDRFVLGSDYVVVLSGAAVTAWLVWLPASGNVTDPEALGGIVIVALFVAAGEMLGQGVAALMLPGGSPRGIGFWRAVHAGAAAVLIAAVLFYAWLVAAG
ncbi:protein kinase domain-containing protein [Paractinoplanes maris]|uniref:protein kinase domain-containing protein n=1 Tax=Paractinoplanes maris TaxID=1734446 RepID=UPI00202255E9|nr:hypothetical protein [Actinoplanes maris]